MSSLALLQLVSPALPVGAFSYSEGLELLVQRDQLQDRATLASWLEAELSRGQVMIEAAALRPLRHSLSQWKVSAEQGKVEHGTDVRDWAQWLIALRDAAEVRAQQQQMGRSLLQLLADLGHPLPDGGVDFGWPVAWAWAGLSWEITPLEVVQGYLFGWVANQLSAAVRLVPLGPTEAQRLQRQLQPLIEMQASSLLDVDPQQLWCGGVGSAIAQLSHAELYSRLFRS